MSVEEADFVYLREKTRTACSVTEKGRHAFEEYVAVLRTYLDI